MSHTFALLVPVKTLALAKSRLELDHDHLRAPLMRAFALDAIDPSCPHRRPWARCTSSPTSRGSRSTAQSASPTRGTAT